MLTIGGMVNVDVKIDGKSIPGGNNVVQSIDVCAGAPALVPTCALTIMDGASELSKGSVLSDGAKIEITVTRTREDKDQEVYKFRVIGKRKLSTNYGSGMRIVGVIDSPAFVNQTPVRHMEGKSDEVLQNIATKCELKFSSPKDFNGTEMNDKQVWLLIAEKNLLAVHTVARRGFISPKSCMAVTLTQKGELRYRNLIDVLNKPIGEIEPMIVHGTPPGGIDQGKRLLIVREGRDLSVTGVMGSFSTYGNKRQTNTLKGDEEQEDKVDVDTGSKALPINSEVKGKAETSRIDYTPRDCGNTHEKYERAYYQNLRMLALFSTRQSLLFDFPTQLDLFDPVIYRQADLNPNEPVSQTDVYVVIGKTISVRGGRFYVERLEISKIGASVPGENDVGMEDKSGVDAMVPDVDYNPQDAGAYGDALGNSGSIVDGMQKVQDGTSKIQQAQQNVAGAINGALTPIADAMNAIDSAVDSVETAVQSAVAQAEAAYAAAEGMYKDITSQVENFAQSIISIPGQIDSTLRQTIAGIQGGIMDTLTASIPGLTQQSVFGKVMNKFKDKAMSKVNDKLSAATTDRLNKISGKLYDQTTKMSNAYSDAWNKTVGFVDNKVEEARPGNAVNRVASKLDQGLVGSNEELRAAVSEEIYSRPTGSSAFVDYNSVRNSTPDVSLEDGLDKLREQTELTTQDRWYDV